MIGLVFGTAWALAAGLAAEPSGLSPGTGREVIGPEVVEAEVIEAEVVEAEVVEAEGVEPAPVPEPTTVREPERGDASGLSPGTGQVSSETDPPEHRRLAIGRLHNHVGLAAGVGLARREVGEATLAATTAVGGLQLRLAGLAERHVAGAKVVRITLPELMLVLELGGTVARGDEPAAAQGLAARGGFAGGGAGVANIGAGWASPGRVGVYGRVMVGQRFLARSTDLDGAYFMGSLGPGAGLRVAAARRMTMLLGGGIDGVLGVQRLARSRLVAQLAPVAEFAVYTQPRPDVYFGLVTRGDITALGRRYGGQRLHGRATAEVVWQLAYGGPFRCAAVLLIYEGSRVEAAPGHPQFDPLGERRDSHQLLLAGGVTF